MWSLSCLHQFLERKSRVQTLPPFHGMHTKRPRENWSLCLVVMGTSHFALVTHFSSLSKHMCSLVGPRSASLNNILTNTLTSLVRLSSIIWLIALNGSFSHSFFGYLFFSLLKNNLRELNESGIQWIILNLLQQAGFSLDPKTSCYGLTKASYDQNMLFVLHNITLNH